MRLWLCIRQMAIGLYLVVAGAAPAAAQILDGPDPYVSVGGGGARIDVDFPRSGEVLNEYDDPEQVPVPPVEEPVSPADYLVGVGDVLQVNFWGRQNFAVPVTVDLEGRLFLPRIGYLEAAGRTLLDVKGEARKAIRRQYPGLKADVTLLSPRKVLIHIAGQVERPGQYQATPLDRVSTVLARAGRLLGSQRRIEIRRKDGTVIVADLLLYGRTGDTAHNPRVLGGDVVYVPVEDTVVSITGAVHRPGRYELTGTKDLREVIELAGGFLGTVTRRLPLRVIRNGRGDRATELEVLLPKSGVPSLGLRDGDQVFIPSVQDVQQGVRILGAIGGNASGVKQLPYVQGETVRALLERAGGPSPMADLAAAYLRHADLTRTPIDLESILIHRDLKKDVEVSPGDALVVPAKEMEITVQGAVVRPGPQPFNPSLSPKEYIARAGGTVPIAKGLDDARVVRTNGKTMKLSEAALLEPGDTIVVPSRRFSPTEVAQLVLSGASLLVSVIAVTVAATR